MAVQPQPVHAASPRHPALTPQRVAEFVVHCRDWIHPLIAEDNNMIIGLVNDIVEGYHNGALL